MSSTNELWNCGQEHDWKIALGRYWDFVGNDRYDIEKEFDSIDINEIKKLDARQWYEFLRSKYFVWKYTAPNRLKTTTIQLERYLDGDDSLENLFSIKKKLFEFDKEGIKAGLDIACKIRGLGTAGASGLLAVLFPFYFGTVDQFAVKALLEVDGLPEKPLIVKMNPEGLNNKEGVILIEIMRRKAIELNAAFNTKLWTTRKIDMVLWVSGR